jgi:hypothetical protein
MEINVSQPIKFSMALISIEESSSSFLMKIIIDIDELAGRLKYTLNSIWFSYEIWAGFLLDLKRLSQGQTETALLIDHSKVFRLTFILDKSEDKIELTIANNKVNSKNACLDFMYSIQISYDEIAHWRNELENLNIF